MLQPDITFGEMAAKGFFTTVDFESSDDESTEIVGKHQQTDAGTAGDDPEEKAKQKRFEPYNKRVRVMFNKLKINDYNSVLSELNAVTSELDKNKFQVEKDGYPPHLLRALISIEEHSNNLTSKDKNRFSKETKGWLTKLKQKVRKALDELTEEVELYKKNPITEDVEVTSEEESEEEESEQKSESKESDDESSKSSESGDRDSESDWDNQNDEAEGVVNLSNTGNMTRQERRKLWLKAPDDPNAINKKPLPSKALKREQKGNQAARVYNIQEVNQDFSSINLTDDSVYRRLTELSTNRAQLTGEKLGQNINILTFILNNSTSKKRRLEVIILLLNLKKEKLRSDGIFLDRSGLLEHFDIIEEFLQILNDDEHFLRDSVRSYLKGEDTQYEKKELESLFVSVLTNLDNDWMILVKISDPDSIEYATLLRDELRLVKLLRESLNYFDKSFNFVSAGYLAYKLLEHVYFLSNSTIKTIQDIVPDYIIAKNDTSFAQTLASMVYNKVPDSGTTTKTALLEAYNFAINNQFLQAKDLLLMYNIPEKGYANDTTIAYYYNRALTALGLCAFRQGRIEDCQDILEELCNSGKLKDLLNQTSIKGYAEREEKRSLVPYHMSMNLENIESAYFVSVMLNEAPVLATQLNDTEKKGTSKLFQKLWAHYEKNPLNGPPENHRDLVYCATKELLKGEWRTCSNLISQLKIWSKISTYESVKELYLRIIKEQAFKTFIFSIRNTHHVLKFDRLAAIFDLPNDSLVSLTCEMIYSGDLQAKLEPKSGCLVTGRRELGDLEAISERINQRIYSVMNLNEKLFDVKVADVNFAELLSATDSNQFRNQKKTKSALRLFNQ